MKFALSWSYRETYFVQTGRTRWWQIWLPRSRPVPVNRWRRHTAIIPPQEGIFLTQNYVALMPLLQQIINSMHSEPCAYMLEQMHDADEFQFTQDHTKLPAGLRPVELPRIPKNR